MVNHQHLFTEAIAHHQAGRLAEAEQRYRQILSDEPDHADALHLLGVIAHQAGRHDAAVELIGKAIGINGAVGDYHSNLGNALAGLGRAEEAVAAYQTAVRIKPDYAEGHYNLGYALMGLGRLEEAAQAYRAAIRLRPDFIDAYSDLGIALAGLGRLEEAVAAYHAAIRLKPDWADAHSNLGIALEGLGRLEEAVAAYHAAIRLRPGFAEAHANLGNALVEKARLDEAVDAYQTAIRLKPDLAGAHSNLGNALREQGRLEEAVAACNTAIRLRPDYAKAHSNLGGALAGLGRIDEAVAACNTAIRLMPDLAEARSNLGAALMALGRFDDAISAYDTALQLKPDLAEAGSNRLFCLNYRSELTGEALLAEHCAWDRRHASGFAAPAHANGRDPERRLKIGYVSGDLCRHSVAYMLEGVLAAHSRSAFEIYCYSTGPKADDMTESLRGEADHWRVLSGLSDEAAAVVRDDGIDILVDLSGHTAHNRLLMFAAKPAPVQVNWIGYPNTTGMKAMDYRIVDPITDPPGIAEGWASEALIRLAGGFLSYRAPPDTPEVAPPPFLADGVVTFGSFNNPPKISDDTVKTWAAVLRRAPKSRLLLKGRQFGEAATRERMTARFAAHGIGPERLSLLPWIATTGSHLEAYGRIDIGLDPFPYNGTVTTCEAMYMGVPAVTLAGERHAARVGASLLAQVGRQDLIARTPEAYVEIAAGLAADTARLIWLRQSLRPAMLASSLGDSARFTRGLEQALRHMWRRWCAGDPPAGFDIACADGALSLESTDVLN